MKITSNKVGLNYPNTNDVLKSSTIPAEKKRITKNFDEIIIHVNNSANPEDKFINDLTSKLSKDIRTPASNYEIDDLKSQIETGTYQISLDEIAKKIMLG